MTKRSCLSECVPEKLGTCNANRLPFCETPAYENAPFKERVLTILPWVSTIKGLLQPGSKTRSSDRNCGLPPALTMIDEVLSASVCVSDETKILRKVSNPMHVVCYKALIAHRCIDRGTRSKF